MKAWTVIPLKPDSASVRDVPEPSPSEGDLLVEMRATGICGTDREIIEGHYGQAPDGVDYLILGHESVGRVIEAPASSSFQVGDHVVGIVRRPDPVPCANCAVLEWDMCQNGLYTERGIKQRHGYGSQRFRLEPAFAVKVDSSLDDLWVLLEPASVVAKAWDHIEGIEDRAAHHPRRVLITGAGPIGLLAALMARQRGYETHLIDRVADGPKPQLARDIGVHYANDLKEVLSRGGFDIAIECTGAPPLILDLLCSSRPNSILCLTGVSSGGRKLEIDIGAINRDIVLENAVIFGTVNANARHYQMAVESLRRADPAWLSRMITRRVPMDRWPEALSRLPTDVKVVIVPS